MKPAAMALAVAASLKEPVAIWSPPRAALELGVGWFAGLVRRAQESEPRARAVFVLDTNGVVRYREVLEDARNEPDYQKVFMAVENL